MTTSILGQRSPISQVGDQNGSQSVFSGSLDQTVSTGELARRLGVSPSYVVYLSNEGVFKPQRLNSLSKTSHRRFNLKESISSFLGEEISESDKKKLDNEQPQIFGYARVSSTGQQKISELKKGEDGEGQLISQIKRLRVYALEHYGIEDLEVFADVGSGVSFTRIQFNKMFSKIINGEYPPHSKLLICHSDRICRIGGEFCDLVLRQKSIEKEIIEDCPIEDESMLQIIQIVTVMASRMHGQRSGKRRQIQIAPEILKTALELKSQNMSYRKITDELEKRKLFDKNGKKLKMSTLRLNLIKMSETYNEFNLPGDITVNQFIKETIIKDETKEGIKDKSKRIQFVKLQEIYIRFCIQNGLTPLSSGKLSKELRGKLSNKLLGGVRFFIGISLKDSI